VVGLLPMGSSRALSRACISQRGRYMLPRGPANAAANAHRGPLVVPPRGRSHHGRAPKVPGAGGTASVGCRVAAGAVLSTGWPVVFDLGADGQSGAGPVPSLRAFSRQCRGLPIAAARDPRGSRDDGGSPVGSPVLKLWNESRTNRARIADSIHVGFRSRPHIVGGRSPTTKSCNRTDTIAATRGSDSLTRALRAENSWDGGTNPGAAPHRTAVIASSRRPCPAAGSRRIASPA
jgi:hypothetical protein